MVHSALSEGNYAENIPNNSTGCNLLQIKRALSCQIDKIFGIFCAPWAFLLETSENGSETGAAEAFN
jgi:hypothetical protein